MGVGLFLFRTLTLKREKSDLNLLMARLSRQKRVITRQSGDLARAISQERRNITQKYQHDVSAWKSSNTSQNTLEGGGTPGNYDCFLGTNGSILNNNPYYLNYQTALENLELKQQEEEARIKEEEADIEEQLALAKTELEQIDAELKEAEKAASEAAKDSAPKYVA